MEYNDFYLPSANDFAKMAKEYSSRLKRQKLYASAICDLNEKQVDEICYTLRFLNWLYSYIKRNAKPQKLKVEFQDMEKEIELNLTEFEEKLFSNPKPQKVTRPRRLNNLSSCLRLGIYTEVELIQKLLKLAEYETCEFVLPIIQNHLIFIQKLSSL